MLRRFFASFLTITLSTLPLQPVFAQSIFDQIRRSEPFNRMPGESLQSAQRRWQNLSGWLSLQSILAGAIQQQVHTPAIQKGDVSPEKRDRFGNLSYYSVPTPDGKRRVGVQLVFEKNASGAATRLTDVIVAVMDAKGILLHKNNLPDVNLHLDDPRQLSQATSVLITDSSQRAVVIVGTHRGDLLASSPLPGGAAPPSDPANTFILDLKTGNLLASILGNGPAKFTYVNDPQNRLFILDPRNGRLRVYDLGTGHRISDQPVDTAGLVSMGAARGGGIKLNYADAESGYDRNGNFLYTGGLKDFTIFGIPTGNPEDPMRFFHAEKGKDVYMVKASTPSDRRVIFTYRWDSKSRTLTVTKGSPANPPDSKTYSAGVEPGEYRFALVQMQQAARDFYALLETGPDSHALDPHQPPNAFKQEQLQILLAAVDAELSRPLPSLGAMSEFDLLVRFERIGGPHSVFSPVTLVGKGGAVYRVAYHPADVDPRSEFARGARVFIWDSQAGKITKGTLEIIDPQGHLGLLHPERYSKADSAAGYRQALIQMRDQAQGAYDVYEIASQQWQDPDGAKRAKIQSVIDALNAGIAEATPEFSIVTPQMNSGGLPSTPLYRVEKSGDAYQVDVSPAGAYPPTNITEYRFDSGDKTVTVKVPGSAPATYTVAANPDPYHQALVEMRDTVHKAYGFFQNFPGQQDPNHTKRDQIQSVIDAIDRELN